MSDTEVKDPSGSESEGEQPVEHIEEEKKEAEVTSSEPAPVQNATSGNAAASNASPGRSPRKAQRTRRVQIKPPPPEEKGGKPAKKEGSKTEKSIDNHTDGDEEEEGEEEEEQEETGVYTPPIDPAKILDAFLAVFGFFGGLFRRVFGWIKALALTVYDTMKGFLPCSVALGLFYLVNYLIATYCVEESKDVTDFADRFQSIVRASALATFPTVLGLLANRYKPNPMHRKFVQQSLEDTLLLFFNTTVLATYEDPECFHWIGVLFMVTTLYRLCHWTSQSYCSSRVQYMFSAPVQVTNIILGLYNVYNIISQDLGYQEMPAKPDPVPLTEPEQGDWRYPDMCGVMEKLFCKVDTGPPAKVHH